MSNYYLIQKENHRIGINEFLSDMMLTVVGVFSFFPYAKAIGNNAWIELIALFVCLGACVAQDTSFFRIVTVRQLVCYFLILYTIIAPYFFGNGMIGNRYSSMILFLIGPYIFEFYVAHGRIKALEKIVAVILAFVAIAWLTTTKALIVNSWIVRSIKSDDISLSVYAQGVGGYEFIYLCTMLAPCLLYCFFKGRSLKFKFLCLTGWAGCLSITVMSNYMTALLLVILSAVCVLIQNMKLITSGIVCFIVLVIGLFWGKGIIGFSIELIENLSGSGRISNLINSNSISLLADIQEEFLGDRWPVMLNSINSWFQHFWIGMIGSDIFISANGFLTGFGQHSFVLDTLALYGVFIGGAYVICVFAPFFVTRICKESNRRKDNPLKIPVFFTFFCLLLFNNATISLAFVVSFIYPIIVIKEKNKSL